MPPSLRILSFVFATVVCLLPARLTAQVDPHSPKADAEAHYQTAVRLFGEGRYREALDEFDAAIELSPESIFYCNRAIVLIQLTEIESALDSLETCQNTFTGDPTDLAAIDAQRLGVERVVRHVRPGVLDTVSMINAPLEAPVVEDDRWTRASTGFVLLAAGGALLASAATLDVLSGDIRERFESESQGPRGSTEEDYTAARNAYVARQRIWIGLTGAGALAVVSGAVLVGSYWLAAPGEETVEVGIRSVGSGIGAAIRLSW